ncbi:MAG: cytidylate kinase-like family protein [Spirochaetaceae bacterium]|jgi:cytidylate kinase|nr:cytidylate kinase-like family protein [Spirochaetaceae bacterium]
MAIITISRELAALGDEIARELAKRLNYRFIDRFKLEECIKSYGVTGQKLEKYDERKPSFLASLSQDRDDYLHYLKTAVLNETKDGDCVVIGRGAFVILSGLPGVVPIYLISSKDVRIARVKSYFHCDEKHALRIIAQSDQDRTGFHKYFFETDWQDTSNYQLTINTSHLHPAVCADLIKNLTENTVNDETEKLFKVRMNDLILAQSIIHHVLYERQIAIHFLEASVSLGQACLFGVAPSASIADAAAAAAKEVPSIENVQSEIQVVHEYSIMP